MSATRRVIAVVEQALERPAEERERWVAAQLADDDLARTQARELLAACARDDSFLMTPLPPGGGVLPAGTRVGTFRIVAPLASGGMGDVYEAEQTEPARRVALKLLRAGLPTEESARRFRFEVSVLARLKHPAIARIHEAGTHENRPYFAMELVEDARTITSFADEEGLSLAGKLELFTRTCDGVLHGHQHGVVHRDLKPANLLVDGAGHPRIIDYGVARSLVADGGQTRAGDLVGTLAYMSPEQVTRPLDVDTRADVYALGVVLYELCIGSAPFDLTTTSLADAVRTVAETAPPDPTRAGVPRELSWIILRALEKDPARRYAGVSELAADVARFLAKEPLEAGPRSRAYHLRKLVERNRTVTAVGALCVLSLVGAVVGTSYGLREARAQTTVANTALAAEVAAREDEQRQREIAEREARRQEAVFDYAMTILGAVSAFEEGRSVTLYAALERNRERAAVEFADDPELRALVLKTLASAYASLSEYDRADELITGAARAAAEHHHDETHPDVIGIRSVLARVRAGQGRWDEADELLAWLEAAADPRDDRSLDHFRAQRAGLRRNQGRYEEAAELCEGILARGTADAGVRVSAAIGLIDSLSELGRLEEAERVAAAAHAYALEHLGEPHPQTMGVLFVWTDVRRQLGKPGIVQDYERLLESMVPVLGAAHDNVLTVRGQLAIGYVHEQRFEDAEALHRENLALTCARHGELHPAADRRRNDLAVFLGYTRRVDEAVALLERTLQLRDVAGRSEHRDTVFIYENIARTYGNAGRSAEALPWFRRAAELATRLDPDEGSLLSGRARAWLGLGLREAGEYAEAEAELRRALKILAAVRGDSAREYESTATRWLAGVYMKTDRQAEARLLFERHEELEARRGKGD